MQTNDGRFFCLELKRQEKLFKNDSLHSCVEII